MQGDDEDECLQEEILAMDFPEVEYDGAVYKGMGFDDVRAHPFIPMPQSNARAVAYVAAMQNIDGPLKAFYCLLLCCSRSGTRLPKDLRALLYGYLLKMWPVPRWPRSNSRLRGGISLPSDVVLQVRCPLTPVFMRETMFGYSNYVYRIFWRFDDAVLAARIQRVEQWLLNSVIDEVRNAFLSSVRVNTSGKGWVLFSRHSNDGRRRYDVERTCKDIVKMSRGTEVIAIDQPLEVSNVTMHISGIYSFKTGHPQKRISRLAYWLAGPNGAKLIGD